MVSAVRPFVALTGTELAALEEAHLRSLRDGDVPADPVGAGGHARQSLRARGLLTADGQLADGAGTDGGGPDLAGAVGLALDVRLAADVVVVAQRLVGPLVTGRDDPAEDAGPGQAGGALGDPGPGGQQVVRSTRVLHLVAEGACVEDVDEEGMHALSLTTDPAQAARALEEALLPPDAVDGCGDPVQAGPAGLDRLADALGRPTVLAELTVLVPGDRGDDPVAASHRPEHGPGSATAATSGPGVLLALGPGGCWAGPARPGDGGRFTLHPVPRTWLGERAMLTVQAVMGSAPCDPEGGTMGR